MLGVMPEAVDFALDGANALEKRLEVVLKIANQEKLAKIVIFRRVAPEVFPFCSPRNIILHFT